MNRRRTVQLALVHVAVSITVVPVTSTLNRVMIADLGLSALLVSVLVALPYLLSPLQILLGDRADRQPIFGQRRAPWILLGGAMAVVGSYFTAPAAYLLTTGSALEIALAPLPFVIWGVGVNVASVSYLALVADLGDEQTRSRTVSTMWTAMILSTIGTSLGLSYLLVDFTPEKLLGAFAIVSLLSAALLLAGLPGLEPGSSAFKVTSNVEGERGLGKRYLYILGDREARRFFLYLLLILVSIHAQDVLLEPFGAEALDMSVSQTSRLTSIWGVGVLLSLLGGVWMIDRRGKKRSANLGALIASVAFALIIGAGLMKAPDLFQFSVFVLGLGGGLMTVSNLSFMLDMTLPTAAGLYVGLWGVANFAGQALGNVISGALRDLFLAATGSPVNGYIAVFVLEIAGLLFAIFLFRRVDVRRFQKSALRRLERQSPALSSE